jgi:hypothetical protein
MTSDAAKDARRIRQAIRRTGTRPAGRVRIVKTDYTTTLEVDLRGMVGVDRDDVDAWLANLQPSGAYDLDIT